jgi:hypothetical protein
MGLCNHKVQHIDNVTDSHSTTTFVSTNTLDLFGCTCLPNKSMLNKSSIHILECYFRENAIIKFKQFIDYLNCKKMVKYNELIKKEGLYNIFCIFRKEGQIHYTLHMDDKEEFHRCYNLSIGLEIMLHLRKEEIFKNDNEI